MASSPAHVLWGCLFIATAQYGGYPQPVAAAPPQPGPGYPAGPLPWLERSMYDPVVNHVCTDDTSFSYAPSVEWGHRHEHLHRHRRLHRVTCSRLSVVFEEHCTRCCRISAQPVPGVSPHVVRGLILSHRRHGEDKDINRCICCAPELAPDQPYYSDSIVQPIYNQAPSYNYQQQPPVAAAPTGY
ncbi:unnamed protein product, partial [Mesorhabditis spiculigera]